MENVCTVTQIRLGEGGGGGDTIGGGGGRRTENRDHICVCPGVSERPRSIAHATCSKPDDAGRIHAETYSASGLVMVMFEVFRV